MSTVFLSTAPATTEIYTLSLHDALPIYIAAAAGVNCDGNFSMASGVMTISSTGTGGKGISRSEEHTSELQSRRDLVCRLLLEKKKEYHQRQERSLTTRSRG